MALKIRNHQMVQTFNIFSARRSRKAHKRKEDNYSDTEEFMSQDVSNIGPEQTQATSDLTDGCKPAGSLRGRFLSLISHGFVFWWGIECRYTGSRLTASTISFNFPISPQGLVRKS